MVRTIPINKTCFFGFPSCNYGFESTPSCFVACPSDEKYRLELDIIAEELEHRHYECYIAVDNFEGAKSVFCKKICSKIIMSQFCLVLLNDSKHIDNQTIYIPNPNVHFEYGLMASLSKDIIPLQRKGTGLSFNIAPLDTIQYTEGTFKSRIVQVLDETIARIRTNGGTGPTGEMGRVIFQYMSIQGFVLADVFQEVNRFVYDLGASLGFMLCTGKAYAFIANFSKESIRTIAFNLKLLVGNVDSAVSRLLSLAKPHGFQSGKHMFEKSIEAKDQVMAPFSGLEVFLIIGKDVDKAKLEEFLTCLPRQVQLDIKVNFITMDEIETDVEKTMNSIIL